MLGTPEAAQPAWPHPEPRSSWLDLPRTESRLQAGGISKLLKELKLEDEKIKAKLRSSDVSSTEQKQRVKGWLRADMEGPRLGW